MPPIMIHKDFGNGMRLWVRPEQVQMDKCASQMLMANMLDELQRRALDDRMAQIGHVLYAAEVPYYRN